MPASHTTAAFEMKTADERYGRISHWVCIYFCVLLTVLFLNGAGAGFGVSAVGVMV